MSHIWEKASTVQFKEMSSKKVLLCKGGSRENRESQVGNEYGMNSAISACRISAFVMKWGNNEQLEAFLLTRAITGDPPPYHAYVVGS